MIFTINSEQGVDMFTKNSKDYLIYEWSRHPNSALFDCKVISNSISSNPSFICHNSIIHLYYIDCNAKLVHKKINRLQPEQNYLFNLAENMNTIVDPTCLIIDQQVYIFAVDQSNRLVQFVHGVDTDQEIRVQCIGENVNNVSQLFLLQSQKCTKVLYRSEDKIKWVDIGEEILKDKYIGILLKINEKCKLKIIQISGSLKILFVSDENQVCWGRIDQQITKITDIEVISQRAQSVQGNFAVIRQQSKIHVFDLISDHQIAICTFQDQKWSSKKIFIQEQMEGGLFITQIYDKICLISFDLNQVAKQYEVVQKQGSFQLVKRQSRPYLLWQQIKDKLKPIGEEGYYADCFLLEDQNLVCKKYRTVHHAIRVKRELDILTQLQKIEPHSFDHLLIEKGALIGFTLPFIRGKMWDQYLDAKNSIFRRSPVARIKLVLKLWENVRKIQQINLCHGDIHFENILIDLDEQQQDLLNPVFEVRLIDYGNAFMMTQGKLVTQGLTGWGPIVPPEAEFSYKRDYNPFGINAYQLARNALFVLLLKPFKAIQNTDYTPLRELAQLKKHEEYPSQLHPIMKELVHYDIQRRNKVLFEDWSALEEKTREIFIGSNKN